MTKGSRLIAFAAAALIALMGGYFAHVWLEPEATQQDAAQVLLSTTLEDLQGRKQPLMQWKGEVMVVNFWATWCPPCLKEIPDFIRLQQRYDDKGVQFLGLAIDDKVKVARFAAQMGINYPVLMAQHEGLTLARNAGNRLGGLPFTVIIDRHGRVARIHVGAIDEGRLVAILEGLL